MKERNASHAYTLQWFLKSKLTSGRLTLLAIRWKTPDETKCDICNGPWKGPRWHRLNTIKKLSWGYSFPPMQFFKKPTTVRHFIKLGKGCTVISALTPSAGFLEIQAVIGFWIFTGTLWRTENLPFATDTSLMGLGLTLALGHQRQACCYCVTPTVPQHLPAEAVGPPSTFFLHVWTREWMLWCWTMWMRVIP